MRCEILSVGTEILLGDIVNTNAQYIAKRLMEIGVDVFNQNVVGDNEQRLLEAYDQGFHRADIIITTGGLGPTKDDITKEVAFKFFNKNSVLHKESYEKIVDYFKKAERSMNETNKKQAYFPEDAIILPNNNGTAPGCIIEEDSKILIMLPGPPSEMKPMFEESVIPYLKKYSKEVMVSKVLRVFGVGESTAADMISDLLDNKNPTVAPYAKEGEMIFRITAKAESEEKGFELIKPIEDKIRSILKENIYGEGEDTIDNVVARLIVDKKFTVATAESCTGGLVAAKLINYPGISESFIEGMVTYCNEAKMKRLGVSKETLDKYGAVSHNVAEEMAIGIAKVSGSHIGISTTGVAGPGGGTKEKPVGLVYVGVYYKGKVVTRKLNLNGTRNQIRNKAANIVLDMVRRVILEKPICYI